MEFSEKFIDRNIAELSENYDLIHSANVNIARTSTDLIDGLKLVQRRALYIMYLKDGGTKFRKVETIGGEVLGRAHPHSSDSIKDAIVNIAQEWRNVIPLVEGFGNFGSVSGDPAGAGRYITARLSEYARACFFDDWKDSVVDMELSYDEETMLPKYLPAKYPNVLINGCLGIGHMGVSFNIPCFNFREVVEATIMLMNNPNVNIILIPDSPTGADIIEADFGRMCERGSGSYMQRCTYEIDAENNVITITSLPNLVTANSIREKIADIKENGGLPELISMNDLSGKAIEIQLIIANHVNPYKFMKKLIGEVPGLERTYPINITVSYELRTVDYSIKQLLLDWINWRREQKRVVVSNKRTTLMAEQRINDVKMFVMNKDNLEKTIAIFRAGRNREEIERKLIEVYHNTPIRMDSLQARALSNMRMVDLCQESYEACVKRAEELEKELASVEATLNEPKGIDKLIIAELRDGIKRFGKPRNSNVVPYDITTHVDSEGVCTLQLSSDGMIVRKSATNADEEPVPNDSNGFACLVDNDASFILVNEAGMHTFIRVKDLPLDTEVPVFRYTKKPLAGNIVAMIPATIDSTKCCALISKKGIVKRIMVADITQSKKPLIAIDADDKLVKGFYLNSKSSKDLLVYTKNGMGQRLDPNSIRITSPSAKGISGFSLKGGDEIVGCYAINPESNAYLLYVTAKGRMRLNSISYLPTRESKHDSMVQLIQLNDRDKLVSVTGCNKLDSVTVYYDDGTSEIIRIDTMQETTMGETPKKVTNKNAVSANIIKVKII